jgi:hypothetical protein
MGTVYSPLTACRSLQYLKGLVVQLLNGTLLGTGIETDTHPIKGRWKSTVTGEKPAGEGIGQEFGGWFLSVPAWSRDKKEKGHRRARSSVRWCDIRQNLLTELYRMFGT